MARWQRHPFRGTLRSIQWCPWLSTHGAQVDVQESLPRQWSQARQRGKQVTKGRPLTTYDPQWASLGPVHENTQDFAQSMAISDGLVLAVTEHSLGNV